MIETSRVKGLQGLWFRQYNLEALHRVTYNLHYKCDTESSGIALSCAVLSSCLGLACLVVSCLRTVVPGGRVPKIIPGLGSMRFELSGIPGGLPLLLYLFK